MKISSALLVILLSAVTAFGVVKAVVPEQTTTSKKETAFERVMRTQTIHCAYPVNNAPRLIFNPNTGEKSGITYDVIEAIGKVLNLKIEWTEEVSYGTFPENLRSGKEDMFCGGVWTSSARAHKAILSTPIMYVPLYAYVRAGDTRFDDKIELMNDPAVSFATMDGTTLETVAKTAFPKAKYVPTAINADQTQPILDVAIGKADALVYDNFNLSNFNRNNPDKQLRRVNTTQPVHTYSEAFAFGMGEWELRDMVNTALNELQNNGTIDRILAKYEPEYGKIMRASDPFAPRN